MSAKGSSQPLLIPVAANHNHPIQYQPLYPGSYQAIPVTHVQVDPYGYRRRSPLRRFILAFLVALGVWYFIKAIVLLHVHHGYDMPWDDSWDIPSNMDIGRCVGSNSVSAFDETDLTSNEFLSDAVFNIPLDAETTLLIARYRRYSHWFSTNPSLAGSLDVTTSARLANNTARIIVHPINRNSNVEACLVTGSNGQAGVGLFVRDSWTGRHQTPSDSIKITVLLPQPKMPLQLKGVIADLPNFVYSIGKLRDAVHFGEATLRTSNAPVKIKSLIANHTRLQTSNALISVDSLDSPNLTVRTSNGEISGTFNTTKTLTLATSNAPIRVTVNLENDVDVSAVEEDEYEEEEGNEGHGSRSTTLHMRTSNDRLEAEINLITSTSTSGGAFTISATTSNAPLLLRFPTSPGNSSLHLNARTSNRPAAVTLDKEFQGAFSLSTSATGEARVRRVDEDDGRRVEYSDVRRGPRGGRVSGYVYSKDKEENKGLGRVVVGTSNAGAELFV
ncbi:putative transmembrane protein [Favolaschia claudopus]|uniref:Transmembrane protein n=1 Tax=Favolaschia claudopus TaxID=2862362 RepID=A0AAV9ZM78_9AGAR